MALVLHPFATHRLAFFLFLLAPCLLAVQEISLTGRVVDPQGKALPGASVQLLDHAHIAAHAITGPDGQFEFKLKAAGEFVLKVNAAGFRVVSRTITVRAGSNEPVEIRLSQVAARSETVTVTADLNGGDVLSPDPAVKVLATEDLLDAIPGYPIETASSGVKAPQYFAPGVAGDHGEPIAMYIQVGSYLAPNNLSANAHGN